MRSLSPAFLVELEKAASRPALFLEVVTSTTTLRWCTCGRDTVLGPFTYFGDGTLQLPDSYSEEAGGEPQGMVFRLISLDEALVSVALQGLRQGAICRLYLAFMGEDGTVLAYQPEFVGRLEDAELLDSTDSSTLQLTYSARGPNPRRDRSWRYNDATQQSFYPGDRAYEYLEQLAESVTGYWGRVPAK